MNRIFNLIWSKTKERWIVVSEKVKGNGKVPSSPLKSIALLAALFAAAGPAYGLDPGALPSGGTITAGSASISTSGARMTVNQSSQQMIADWQSFNIGQNAAVRFNQPNITASALNRITDQNPTQIMGSLSANGQVFLLNPSGIIFGKTAQVNVGGLVASSLTMLNSDYLAGKNIFTNNGTAGVILNQGSIMTPDGGVVALIAPKVTNEGSITVPGGSALLAGGNQLSVDFTGDGLISYTVDQGAVDALVENKGLIKVDGGVVVMTTKAADALRTATVTNSGVIEARTIENKAGRILLLSDIQSGQTTVSGTLDASAPNGGDGGFIETSGAAVKIADGTQVTTIASQGKSGTWLIDPTNFTISSGSAPQTVSGIGASTLSTNLGLGSVTITTSAAANPPDLGDINVDAAITWSANTLSLTAHNNININQSISATGSGNLTLAAGSTISAIAPVSIAGIFTLTSGTWSQTGALQPFFANDFRIAGGTFIRATGGDGTLGTPYLITDIYGLQGIGSSGMTGNNYLLANPIIATNTLNWNNGAGFTPIGSLFNQFSGSFDGLGNTITDLTINLSTDNVGLFGVTSSGSVIRNVGLVTPSVTGGSIVGALVGWNYGAISGSAINGGSVTGGGYYVGGLVGDNDSSSGTVNISTCTVSQVDVTGKYSVGGLVGYNSLASISGGSVTGGSVTSVGKDENTGSSKVGGLVGDNNGGSISAFTVSDVNVAGSFDSVGGLVGYNSGDGIITASFVSGAGFSVSGSYYVGGLVGYNDGVSISGSSVTGGSVTGVGVDAYGSSHVGGLVGQNNTGTISGSSVTGVSVGGSGDNVGGLVGYNIGGSISGSSVTDGTVTGLGNVGGLVGYNDGGSISVGSVTGGSVTGATNVGGLVGKNYFGSISSSSVNGLIVSGSGSGSNSGFYIGGLVGQNYNSNISSCTVSGVDVTGVSFIGGLVGLNQGRYGTANISDSAITGGSVIGSGSYVGGLVGFNDASYGTANISDSSVTGGSISGSSYVGGLVGINSYGTITGSFVTGTGGSVTGSQSVGGLVGQNQNGTISGSFVNGGSVIGSGYYVGGLVGRNMGAISGSFVTDGSLIGDAFAGGLVGRNYGAISGSSVTGGNVTGTSNVGGLVGENSYGSITDSHISSGSVTGSGVYVGGLVGYNNNGSISGGSVTGISVSGNSYVGGLVGYNNNGSISGGSVTGISVSGNSYVGGLVGDNYNGAISGSSVSVSNVTGTSNVGGLVGRNSYGIITDSFVNGSGGSVSGNSSNVGGLVGINTVGLTTGVITNSFYDLDNVEVYVGNGSGGSILAQVTPYGIYGIQFADWLSHSKTLSIDNYFNLTAGYYQITNFHDVSLSEKGSLKSILGFVNESNTGYKFKLTTPVDLSTSGFWIPIFNATEFNGSDGSITGLSINQPMNTNIGMIGVQGTTSTTTNLSVSTVSVAGSSYVGGLVAKNLGIVSGSSVSGGGVIGSGNYVGGLVGDNFGTISGSTRTDVTGSGVVSGSSYVGGLVGRNLGIISGSTVSGGSVTASGYDAGGLVGRSWGYFGIANISDSHVFGVSVNGSTHVGGLVGRNTENSTITDSSVSGGSVSGSGIVVGSGTNAGGLVGYNDGTINGGMVTGVNVNGIAYVGGLVGNNNIGSISGSSVTDGQVNSSGNCVGGLVGMNDSSISSSSVISITGMSVIGSGNYVGGLVGWNNSNNGNITAGFVSGSGFIVSGSYSVGGLVGYNGGSINGSSSSGVIVTGSSSVGGLVGENYGGISFGSVSGVSVSAGGYNVGGLVGYNYNGGIGGGSVTGGSVNGSSNNVGGLVGKNYLGSISGSSVSAGNISGSSYVGGLVGYNNQGSIGDSFVTGSIVRGSYDYVAGLVGYNDFGSINGGSVTGGSVTGDNTVGGLAGYTISYGTANIIGSTVTGGSVTGNYNVGGLVGWNINGGISDSSVSGSDVTGISDVGGLVGMNAGSISSCSVAGGSVIGSGYFVGGLVGQNTGSISGSSVSGGSVSSSSNYVGGLVGNNYGYSTIQDSYASVSVTGYNSVGGLVGNNSGSITNTYETGTVSGSYGVGALVGTNNSGTITHSFYDKTVNTVLTGVGGTADVTDQVEGKTSIELTEYWTFKNAGWDIDLDNTLSVAPPVLGYAINNNAHIWWIRPTDVTFTFSSLSGTYVYNGSEYVLSGLWSSSSIFGSAYSSWTAGTDYTFTYSGGTVTGFTNAGSYSPISITVTKPGYLLAAEGNTSGTFTISPKTVTLSATKTYDGTTTFGAGTVTIGTGIAGEALSYSGATSNDAHVATSDKYINGITLLSGTGLASNYALPSLLSYSAGVNSVTITAATLTPTLTNTGVTKVYDTTTDAPSGFTPTYSFVGLVSGDTNATLSNSDSEYNSANVLGANKVTVSGLSISGITGTNSSVTSDYTLSSTSEDVAATITAKTVTLSATKSYDGTTTFGAGTVTIGTGIAGEALSYSGATSNDAHVATSDKYINGITLLSGTGLASNYALPSLLSYSAGVNSVTITAATLTPTLTNTGVTKVYDTTTDAPFGFTPTYSFVGLVSGDTSATLSSTGSAYDNKNAGVATKVTVSGLSISGITGTNSSVTSDYTLSSTSEDVAATITAKTVTLSATKTYDGTTTFGAGTVTIGTGIAGEALSYSGATSNDAHVATSDKYINGITLLSGTGLASNYALPAYSYSSGVNSVTITAATLTPTLTNIGVTKVYDSTTDAPFGFTPTYSFVGLVSGDTSATLSSTGSAYDNKNAGVATKVTVSGLSISGITGTNSSVTSDYTLSSTSEDVAATITAKTVTLSATKTYDGTTTFGAGTVTIGTGIAGEALSYSGATSNDAHVATSDKYINGITLLSGTGLASNYALPSLLSYSVGVNSVTITAATLTPTLTNTGVTKVYDTTTDAPSGFTPTYSFIGLVSGDTNATLSNSDSEYNSANVLGANKVTVSGLSISGITGTNSSATSDYTLSSTSKDVAATITAKTVTLSATKSYDGTTTFGAGTVTIGGLLGGQTLGYSGATSNDAHAATLNKYIDAITLSDGTGLASNYALPAYSYSSGVNSVTITAAMLTPTLTNTGVTKVYDSTTDAPFGFTPTYSFVGLVSGDMSATLSSTGSAYDNKNAGVATKVTVSGLSISGITGTNSSVTSDYTLSSTSEDVAATITAKTVTLSATKSYDGTTTFGAGTVTIGTGIAGEALNYSGATSNDAHVATSDKYINGITLLSGTGLASNYALPAYSYSAGVNSVTITAATLTPTLTNIGVTKVYDTTTDAPFGFTPTYSFIGLVSGDTSATLSSTGSAYDNKNAGVATKVTVSGLSISGITGTNSSVTSDYTLSSTSEDVAATITAKTVTLSATKSYDGTTTFGAGTVTIGTGIAGEALSYSGATSNDAHVATSDKYINGITLLSGTGLASNYALPSLLSYSAGVNSVTITAATLTPTLTNIGVTKVYDSTTAAPFGFTPTYSFVGLVSGDTSATLSSTGSAYDNKNAGVATKVTVSGLSISGITGTNSSATSDYMLSSTSEDVAATITAKTVTLSATKTYDGTTTFGAGTVTIGTGIAGEALNYSGATSNDAHVATSDKYINGITLLSGTGLASNYALPSLLSYSVGVNSVTITSRTVTLSATKLYDGTTDLTGYVTVGTGIVNESLTYSGATAYSKDVADNGSNYISSITLHDGTGGLESDYQLPSPLNHTNAPVTITSAPLTVVTGSLTGTISKVYDGTDAATLTPGNYLLSGFVTGEGASVTKSSGTYDTPDAGIGKTVTVNLLVSDYLASGMTNLSNYSLPTTVSGAIGAITPASLTVRANDATKSYDGIAYSGGNGVTYTGFVHSESSGVLGGTLGYSGSSQGAVNAGAYVITPEGLTSSNYTLSFINGALTINQAPLTVVTGSLTGTISKVYDGTDAATLTPGNYLLSGFVTGEGASVTKSSGTYDTPDAGIGKTVTVNLLVSDYLASGMTNLSNYSLPTTVSGAIGAITPASLTVRANDAAKSYDRIAYSGGNGVTYTGFVHSESSGVLGGTLGYSGSSQGAVNAGAYDITPEGLTSSNYALSFVNGVLTVNASQYQDEPKQDDPLLALHQLVPSSTSPPLVISDGIMVQIVREPSGEISGVIAVSVPRTMTIPGSGFSFELPEQIKRAAAVSGVKEKTTMLDGSVLPYWLQFDRTTQIFIATNIPEGALPVQILVSIGDESWIVEITMQ